MHLVGFGFSGAARGSPDVSAFPDPPGFWVLVQSPGAQEQNSGCPRTIPRVLQPFLFEPTMSALPAWLCVCAERRASPTFH